MLPSLIKPYNFRVWAKFQIRTDSIWVALILKMSSERVVWSCWRLKWLVQRLVVLLLLIAHSNCTMLLIVRWLKWLWDIKTNKKKKFRNFGVLETKFLINFLLFFFFPHTLLILLFSAYFFIFFVDFFHTVHVFFSLFHTI